MDHQAMGHQVRAPSGVGIRFAAWKTYSLQENEEKAAKLLVVRLAGRPLQLPW